MHLFDPLGTAMRGAAASSAPSDVSTQPQVVVSLDDDLLGPGPAQAIHGRAWGERHGDARTRSRMRLFDGGDDADADRRQGRRRLAVPPSRLPMLAQAVAGGSASVAQGRADRQRS